MAYSGSPSVQFAATTRPEFYHYDPSTPPPPPPKPVPSSGPPSGRGTPASGPPLPPPPHVATTSSPALSASNPAVGSGPSNVPFDGTQGSSLYQEHSHQTPVPLPESGWLPSIVQDLSTQDLKELVENQTLQTALLNNPATSHPSLSASQEPIRQLLESNIASASALQQLEARLVHQRQATQSRLLALRALEQQHRSKIADTENELRRFSPMALYQRLNASMQEQDALVKGIEESFLEEGGMSNDREMAEFVRRVREAKKIAFLRSERKERWDEGRVGGWR